MQFTLHNLKPTLTYRYGSCLEQVQQKNIKKYKDPLFVLFEPSALRMSNKNSVPSFSVHNGNTALLFLTQVSQVHLE